eukprot:5261531-Prymnesium_polylepis.1
MRAAHASGSAADKRCGCPSDVPGIRWGAVGAAAKPRRLLLRAEACIWRLRAGRACSKLRPTFTT